MPAVNPEILVWARETAALELAEAARKLGFKDSKISTAIEKLVRLESGNAHPTRAQLGKVSKVYHQPLITFYLSQPPIRGDRGEDFRSLPEKTSDRKGNAHLDLLMRNVKAAQSLVMGLLEEESAQPLSFIGSASTSAGYETVADDIRRTIGFDLQEFRRKRSARDAFAYLRNRIKRQRIFVLLMSDLGSHHSTIPVEVFRGFAFADPLSPFVVINRQDAVSAWSFTALHELAHLWLGNSGVSGTWSELAIERFCNRVAGTILLPPDELRQSDLGTTTDFDQFKEQISQYARERNVSRAMVTYNLLLHKRIYRETWQKLVGQFEEDRNRQQEHRRATNESKKGGPSYYAVRRHHLGAALIGLAKQYVGTGQLTPSKAGVVLGVPPRNVYPLLFPGLT